MLVFDIETDGLLDTVSKVHCLNLFDRSSGRAYRFTDHEFYQNKDGSVSTIPTKRDGALGDGLKMLAQADAVAGHNIIEYDLPALSIVYPGWEGLKDGCNILDSRVMAELMYPTLKDKDFAATRKGTLPRWFVEKGLVGRNSLKAWGIRIGKTQKDDFDPKDFGHTWSTIPFVMAMDDYCAIDVKTNNDVFDHFLAKGYSNSAFETEMRVRSIIFRQVRYGFAFNIDAARQLEQTLTQRHVEIAENLRSVFKPFWVRAETKTFVPKRDNKKLGYVADAPVTKVKEVIFNPASRDHIANRLTSLFNWTPTEFTDGGKPKVDETILGSLPWPEAKMIADYLMLEKRLGQLCDGRDAWLKHVKEDGRIHGRVNTLGTITTRMSHSKPNVAQVPASKSEYGEECRRLFGVSPGAVLVGCDAEGLELRMLAHFMARWDGGAYAKAVVEGRKEDGTDAHTLNQKALGLNSRENAKTWFYAFIYGAGSFKLGTVVLEDYDEAKQRRFYAKYTDPRSRTGAITRLGKKSRDKIATGLPALGKFIDAVKKSAARGWLKGLDGRRIYVRSDHSAPNTLLQGNGALVMKVALILMDDAFQQKGLTPGEDYEFVANVHDEVQIEVRDPVNAEFIGDTAATAIADAGRHFDLRCPLAGAYDIGQTWADTH